MVDLSPSRCVVLVLVGHHIEPDCDAALRQLERRGYPIMADTTIRLWHVGKQSLTWEDVSPEVAN